MALNQYLNTPTIGVESEQNLIESMTIESIQITGQDYIYIPRTLQKYDQILGEDVLSSFDSYATVEMYLLDFSGYGGESEIMSKFGMEIRDTASFVVSRKRFAEEVVPIVPETRNEKIKWRPCEGDLIYSQFSKSLFMIKFIEDEEPGFYQLNKKYVWTLRCELVLLNNEKFNTGNETVDTQFGTTLNRLDNVILSESGLDIILESGGCIVVEEFKESEQYNDLIGFGDNSQFKKEFLEIMEFDPSDPFRNK